ncbi:MAG: hypothetical protein MUC83_19285 [Pirellula sp.]|jgi:hypothetical protein|nr:hypothetical protein [Pirellula sp.]
MRQVNIAKRFVNVVAIVRNSANVAVVKAAFLLSHLHKRMTGTTDDCTRLDSPNGYPWSEEWQGLQGRMQAQLALQPVVKSISKSTKCKSS